MNRRDFLGRVAAATPLVLTAGSRCEAAPGPWLPEGITHLSHEWWRQSGVVMHIFHADLDGAVRDDDLRALLLARCHHPPSYSLRACEPNRTHKGTRLYAKFVFAE